MAAIPILAAEFVSAAFGMGVPANASGCFDIVHVLAREDRDAIDHDRPS